MITLNKLREIDPSTANLTDEELKDIRQSFYEFGQLIFDDWHDQKFGSKSPVGSLTNKDEEDKI